jgi:cytochrome-b5 reductase
VKEILKNPEDTTEISLIFANNTEEDILLKNVLDNLEEKHANFKVTYVVSKALIG